MPARGILFLCFLAGCGSVEMHVVGAPSASPYLVDFEGKPARADLGHVRFHPSVCHGYDTKPTGRPLEAEDFVAFLKEQKLDARVVRARNDLVFVDVLDAGTDKPLRFRIATRSTPGSAGRELHTALLQRGPGTWGLHRSNLAVLAPPGEPDEVVVLASKHHLACWGVLMMAGNDDTFVVPGGYTEL